MGELGKLVDLIERLRAPDGCPWDREQTLGDPRAYLLEEAHETAAALDQVVAAGDPGQRRGPPPDHPAWAELAGELGDLLFQVVFVARLAEEAGAFRAGDVVDRIHAKMIERHPHVFPPAGGPREELADAAAVSAAWERRKLAGGERHLLAGVPASLPALVGAYRLTQKAAGVGFDWPDAAAVLAKVDEEIAELRAELATRQAADPTEASPGVREEVGDLLFTVANLARKLGVDPEAALAATNLKFRRRFEHLEGGLASSGSTLGEASLEAMEGRWEAAKAAEKRP